MWWFLQKFLGYQYPEGQLKSQEAEKFSFHNTAAADFENICTDYFDLNTDYSQIKKQLAQDETLKKACDFAGGDIREALPYACAVEYIHTYSLIHDDLPAMDNDDLRRGLPTNHKVYGEAIAILAGDGLLTTAFEAINKDMMLYFDSPEKMTKRIKAAYEISKGAGCRGMVAGQVSDIEGEHNEYSNEMLEYIHINKTGALMKSAIRAGLYLGEPSSFLHLSE